MRNRSCYAKPFDTVSGGGPRARPGITQLNHPETSLQRFDLIQALHVAGINSFNAYRLGESSHVRRFPVFIWRASGTTKHAPALLPDADSLKSALAAMPADHAARADMIIVECGNATDEDGYFRKYGAYRVGDRLYPQHVVLDRQWFAKFPVYRGNRAQKRAQNAYFHDTLQVDALTRIFAIAGIDYGRIDYCVVDGKVEVFEINTNPSVLNNPPTRFDRFDYGAWADRHANAMTRLGGATGQENLATPGTRAIRDVHEEIVAKLTRKLARRRARATLRLAFKGFWSALPMAKIGRGKKPARSPLTRAND